MQRKPRRVSGVTSLHTSQSFSTSNVTFSDWGKQAPKQPEYTTIDAFVNVLHLAWHVFKAALKSFNVNELCNFKTDGISCFSF